MSLVFWLLCFSFARRCSIPLFQWVWALAYCFCRAYAIGQRKTEAVAQGVQHWRCRMSFRLIPWMGLSLLLVQPVQAEVKDVCRLASPDGLNTITVGLTDQGSPVYRVERRGRVVVRNSALGLRCAAQVPPRTPWTPPRPRLAAREHGNTPKRRTVKLERIEDEL